MTAPRRKISPPLTEAASLHHDLREASAELRAAAEAMNNLSGTLQPLTEHVPALISMANTWKAGEAVGRTARIMGGFVKWAGGVAIGVAAIWAVLHMKFLALLGNQP